MLRLSRCLTNGWPSSGATCGRPRRGCARCLEALADKYGITAKDVSYAIDGYADDMLSDLVFGIERDLEQEAERDAPLSSKSA